jgi:hypothetical protein
MNFRSHTAKSARGSTATSRLPQPDREKGNPHRTAHMRVDNPHPRDRTAELSLSAARQNQKAQRCVHSRPLRPAIGETLNETSTRLPFFRCRFVSNCWTRSPAVIVVVGRLAATVAHEVNNPLDAVANLLYLAEHNVSVDEATRGHLKMAGAEVKRAATPPNRRFPSTNAVRR